MGRLLFSLCCRCKLETIDDAVAPTSTALVTLDAAAAAAAATCTAHTQTIGTA